MHHISVQPHHETTFFNLRSAVKVALVALITVYAAVYFSAPYWIALGLLVGLGLAFAFRVKALDEVAADSHKQLNAVICSDGGTFRNHKPAAQSRNSRPVVHDGGSFERSR